MRIGSHCPFVGSGGSLASLAPTNRDGDPSSSHSHHRRVRPLRPIHFTYPQKGEKEDKKAPDLANYQKAKHLKELSDV